MRRRKGFRRMERRKGFGRMERIGRLGKWREWQDLANGDGETGEEWRE